MWQLGVIILSAVYGVFAKQNCPLYGLGYPKPTDLLGRPETQKAAAALDSLFFEYFDNSNNTKSSNFSYSVEVFSTEDEEPLWSHYRTAPNLKGLNSTGVDEVDGTTVYRIGSVTKVFTMLTFLAEVGDSLWNEPITNYIPEIAALVDGADNSHSISTADWESITLGSLASQMSGLERDYALVGELTQGATAAQAAGLGFPIIDDDEIPPCGNRPVCNRTQFFQGLKKLPPSFSPYITPAYSNIGFTLLGYALEQMTGKPFNEMVQDRVLKPLNLTRTFYSAPQDSLGVIPGDRYKTNWAFDLGNESPTGNMYTSSSDLSQLGREILKSTLLPPTMTRRWLKPVVFSSDPKSGIGMPWGVRQLPLSTDMPYQFATTFNKAGTLGKYDALLAIIPDFNIGFSVLAAGDGLSGIAMDMADILSNVYLPTMVNTARAQADEVYSGTYKSSEPGVNSTLTVVADSQTPGLSLSSWISNGTNLMWYSVVISQGVQEEYWGKVQPSVRLYPTGLWDAVADGGKRVAFKAVFEDLSLRNISNPFTTDCVSWVTGSGILYGSRPLDQFIFNIDATGKVTSVENGALRNKLDKV
ncbi:beta-lactamase/transpeptidase-like protein [Annulohypoxylon maeteangense]|uniref:beta-lactamase/transpeptidase-like protein n=1 Tax=Annulohypoxylon maeteangense TaxID=1927788 RepID=UPI002007D62E|nr:beta-lactamase/transpeptidase-like protein [Annulohypoxylon maeteangense]KAI0888267.1 beta-lactamase/transpeptidase-like protein [Annulohypoxylon maeteangense]